MSNADTISLAVWDVPMPVVAGEKFVITVGAKSLSGRALAGELVEVSDAKGAAVASATLGDTPLPGTEALYWTVLEVPAPRDRETADYTARLEPASLDAVPTRFSVAVAARPAYTLTVTVTERDTKAALDGVEIRVGPFHARTDKAGRAELRVSRGDFLLQLWRTAHIAEPQPIRVGRDDSLELTMVHVPEEHPDARWVR
ncbi:MAG: hypothetical protein K2Y27_27130 [Xanthobacteraceae bacterium]|nr:hypothetical protein [Xanthobacteraceae bacterium]